MVHRHARHLYLARHAEPTDDGSALTDRGTRRATLLGKRLAGIPLAVVHHGPLPRAMQTTRVVAGHLAGVPVREHERHELVVTHGFPIGWLVRHTLGGPPGAGGG